MKAIIIALILLPSPLLSGTSWEEAIELVREKQSNYYGYALKLGSGHPGTALNGLNHEIHICAIVGRMLGFIDEIKHAETIEDPPLIPEANPHELMAHSVSLDSWVAAALRATAMTQQQKKSLWNLECIGRHGIPIHSFISDPGLDGDFSVLGNSLVVYGNIESGFYSRFKQVLDVHPEITEIALGSAGGSVADAILSGLEIRRRGLSTNLHGPCFSACPLIFMGGADRMFFSGPGQFLGFHRVYNDLGEVPLDHEIYRKLSSYMVAMGVDPVPVLQWMANAGPDEIFEPQLEKLCEVGVATWISRAC